MRIGLVIIFFAFITGSVVGQNKTIDSLQHALQSSKRFQDRVTILHKLASEFWDYDFEKGLSYAQEAFELAQTNGYIQGQVEALTDIGQYHYFTGDYTKAKEHYTRAIEKAGENNFGEYPAHTFIRLGNLYRIQSQFAVALTYYQKAESYLSKQRSDRSEAYLQHNLALLYFEQGDFKGALVQSKKALAIRLTLRDSAMIAESWKQMGNIYVGLSVLDSAEYYLNKVQGIAMRSNNPELLIFYYLHFGDLLFAQGKFTEASDAYLKANDLLAGHDFFRYRALIYKSIGALYEWRGDYQRALEYLLKALQINEKLSSKQEIAKIYNAIGWVYLNQGNIDKADAYANQSYDIMRSIQDRFGVSSAHTLKARIFSRDNKDQLALLHYDSAIVLRREIGAQLPLATVISFRADLYLSKNQLLLAEADLKKVVEITQFYSSNITKARALNTLSIIELKKGAIASAIQLNEKARQLAQEMKSIPELRTSYLNLIEIYKYTQQKDNAIKAFDRYLKLSDSLLNAESLDKQAQMNALYQVEKKENEISLLNQENLAKQNQIDAQTERIKSQNYLIILFVTASVLLVVLAYVLFYYSRLKKRDNEKLKRLNEEVQEKNEEIQTQSEELVEANKILSRLNDELLEKQEEVKAQAEELLIANESINQINRDLEATVKKRTEQLQTAYNELDIFFYRSSHDFRRPLTTFLGLAEVAAITVKEKNAIDLFAKVKETAASFDKMLFKLQSISDIGSQQLIFKEVRLKELLYEVIDLFKQEIDNRKIKIQLDVATTKYLYSNPVLLKIVLENLLENAISFCHPETPVIKISVMYTHSQAIISIEDNGQGIQEEYHDRVFEMYFRANEKSKGNGLGLYIVKKAVGKLNGKVTFQSVVHKGSTFILNIPLS